MLNIFLYICTCRQSRTCSFW